MSDFNTYYYYCKLVYIVFILIFSDCFLKVLIVRLCVLLQDVALL